jgi:hypothetical protein
MCVISTYVNSVLRYRNGEAPPADPTLRAFVGAWLLHHGLLDIDTVTKAVVAAGSSRPSVEAALTLLKSEDQMLIASVLAGGLSLQNAAAKVRSSVKLIEAFKNATEDDCRALGAAFNLKALSPNELFEYFVPAP